MSHIIVFLNGEMTTHPVALIVSFLSFAAAMTPTPFLDLYR
jgi:hypothetical protein